MSLKMSGSDLKHSTAAMQNSKAVCIFTDSGTASFSQHLGILRGFFNASIPGAAAAPTDMVRNEIR